MNIIINTLFSVILTGCLSNFIISQGTFDVIPTTDGQHSQLHDVYADSNFIYIIGEYEDSTIVPPGKSTQAWWGVLDYTGSFITRKTLFDKNLSNNIGVFGSRILKSLNGNLIYVPILYNSNGWAECLAMEIKPATGDIINFNVIGNPVDSSTYVTPAWVALDPFHKEKLLLAANLEVSNLQRSIIFLLDSNLNVTNHILIDDNGKDNYNFYLEADSDSTYILIGESRKRNDNSPSPDIKPYFMRVNARGEILKFNLATGIPDKSVGFFLVENMTIKQDLKGNWIFSALSYFPGWHTIPYVFSYDSEFKKMNWAINFSANKSSSDQIHNLFGGDYDESNGSYVVVGNDLYQNDSYIFKTNHSGDSLWTRHLIPLNWKSSDVVFAELLDVKTTPYHSYISVGSAVNSQVPSRKSWAILIDSFGCIIPGCQNIVNNHEVAQKNGDFFDIYPNPATTHLGLLATQELSSPAIITVFDLSGRVKESLVFSPKRGYQYIVNVSGWATGIYFLRVDSSDGKFIQQTKLLIE